jgi:heavy metal translocating P-type ATPase
MSGQGEETSFDEVIAPVHHARRLAVIAAMAVAATASFLGLWHRLGLTFDAIGLAATLAGGWPVWREAWEALRGKQINMEITMALGVAAALAIGQFATAAIIVAFTLFSMYLEDLTKGRGKRALEALLRAAPEGATVHREGKWVQVQARDVRPGERVLVKAGTSIPVDGLVREGHGSVMEAPITGEPFPQEKSAGSRVFAGTTNGNGTLEIEASRAGTDTTYARIVGLVRDATERKGRTQRLADKLAQGIVYVVALAAAVTFLLTRNPVTVVSVILVAGACGVAAGTPLAILATTAKNAKRGVILKGGEAVEALARVDTIVLDKTGTLTRGEPAIHRVHAFDGTSEADLLDLVAAVEQGSDHPIARAVLAKHTPKMRADRIESVAGRGVRGRVGGRDVLVGNSSFLREAKIDVPQDADALGSRESDAGRIVALVAAGGRLLGALVVTDELRPQAAPTVRRLREAGHRVIMLTGDREGPAREAGRKLGIDDVRADLLPEDKIRIVRDLQASGRRVCFVGDGINDAPALAEADVGVAMQSGTEAAMETADAQLMTNDLSRLADALEESRRAQRVILFNLGGTMVVDGVGIVLAAIGLLGPLLAALVHVASELAFILNSARLFAAAERSGAAGSQADS